jgi:hypothetical protein
MAVFLQPTTVFDRPTMVRTTSVGVLSYTSHPSLRGVPSVPVALRSWFNALFRVVQTRETYERSKNALEAAVNTMARSFDALGQGATSAFSIFRHLILIGAYGMVAKPGVVSGAGETDDLGADISRQLHGDRAQR